MLWYLVVLVKILSFQAIGLEVEDYLSQKRYEWKIGRSCHEDTQSLENSKSCLFENPKYDLVRDGDAVAKKQSQQNEKFFFDEASRER